MGIPLKGMGDGVEGKHGGFSGFAYTYDQLSVRSVLLDLEILGDRAASLFFFFLNRFLF